MPSTTPSRPATSALHRALHSLRSTAPGLIAAFLITALAQAGAHWLGGNPFLYALLLGMALHTPLMRRAAPAPSPQGTRARDLRPGVEFAAKKLVRIGVALLGARIAFADVSALGLGGALALSAALGLTILFGLLMARLLRQPWTLGLLSGGATGICGVSAAMAISATLEPSPEVERHTLMTAIGMATFSTLAMVLYPLWVRHAGLDVAQAGLFLGGSIHDVAQVVGAGSLLSPEVTRAATLAKMFRVALLLPVVLSLALILRRKAPGPQTAPAPEAGAAPSRPPLLPFFLLAFAALMAANSFGLLPAPVQNAASTVSYAALLISIAALGLKTSLLDILTLGWRPAVLLAAETAFIALFMAGVIWMMR